MTTAWQEAATHAERALRGDLAARRLAQAAVAELRTQPPPLHRPQFGRDLGYLAALLDTLDLLEESHRLIEHVVGRIFLDPASADLSHEGRNNLAVALADRGELTAAAALLSTMVVFPGRAGPDRLWRRHAHWRMSRRSSYARARRPEPARQPGRPFSSCPGVSSPRTVSTCGC